jgi:hypothetical protein
MSTETKEIEVVIEHPLEEIFDIESGTTIIPRTEKTTELVASEEYDDKDNEIENQFQEVYDTALAAFEDQVAEIEILEGKYKARNMEVGVQLLNTALAAAKEKSGLKQHKDKTAVAKGKLSGKTVNHNNLIVADRNDLLKTLMGKKED